MLALEINKKTNTFRWLIFFPMLLFRFTFIRTENVT